MQVSPCARLVCKKMSPNSQYKALHNLERLILWVAVIGVLAISDTWSAPITFNTALPVAKSEFIFREQFVVNQSGHDPSTVDRDWTVWSAVSVLGYGVTAKLAVFGVLPYVNKNLDLMVSGQRRHRNADGLGDISLFGRYTVYQMDWPGRTLRVAPFAQCH